MKAFGRGVSTVGVIVIIVVLGAVGFAVAYFGSDVFRTKTDATLTQFTQWTPENIAKDPVNYLNFCEKQTKAAIDKCKASKIAIAQKKGKIDSMLKDASDKHSIGSKAIEELKVLYKQADEGNTFPLKWRTKDYTKDDARRQIMKLAGEIKTKGELKTKLESAITQLKTQEGKLANAEDDAKEQLAKIDANRELLKVQQITESLKENLVSMKGAIETSIVGIANTESTSLSLDDLAAGADATVSDADFNKILNEK
jgi:hypothetical protein